jgi:hypothetical protein
MIVALQPRRPHCSSRKSRRLLALFCETGKPHSLWDGKAAGAIRSFKVPVALPPDGVRKLDFQGKIPHFPINAAV